MNNFLARNKYTLSLHGIIFLWGFTGVLGRLISISSFSLVWWRMSIATLGLLAFMVLTNRSFRTSWKYRLQYLATGVVTAGHWILFFEAINVSNVSITLTTMASASLFVAFLEPLFFKRKIIGYEILFGLLTIGGLAVIFQFENEYGLGILLALGSAFLAAVFGTVNGIFVKQDSPTLITTIEMIGGVLGITLYYALTDGYPALAMPVGIDWVWLLILGLICTSFAFVVSIEVMKELSPYTVTISINMEPIYAIIFALIIFQEDEFMSPGFYFGALIVMSMIFLNSYFKRRSRLKASRSTESSPDEAAPDPQHPWLE